MSYVASHTTRVDLATSPSAPLLSSGTLDVYGFIVANASASADTVDLESADGTFLYATVTLAADTSFETNNGFVADRGLRVNGGAAGVIVTIFHSHIT